VQIQKRFVMNHNSKESHGFSVAVACEIGVKRAIIIQHILFLQRSLATSEQGFRQTWVKRSMKALADTYPYLTVKEIRGAVDGLEQSGYIVSKTENQNVFDRVKSFQVTKSGLELMGIIANYEKANASDKRANGASDKRANDNVTKGQMLNSFNYIVNNIVEGECENEKPAPPPTPAVENFDSVEAEKKEKKLAAGAAPNRAAAATHVVATLDQSTLPGHIIATVEAVNLTGPSEPAAMSSEPINRGGAAHKASNAMEAQKIIESWIKENGDQVRWSYDNARRRFTEEDLHSRVIDFCGHYATSHESAKKTQFFLDPSTIFRDGLTKWLQTQNQFDREKESKAKSAGPQLPARAGSPRGYGGDMSKYEEKQIF
jgi:hypothetical protein